MQIKCCCFHYNANLNKISYFDLEKLIEYLVSAVNVVSSNRCVRPSPRIKISLFLLSTCADELISTHKIMRFLPMLPSGNINSECKSNPMP